MITGVTRSGTSLLGRLIASLQDVEYEYEPWFLDKVPVLIASEDISADLGVQMLNHYLHELVYTRLLGRHLNLKPSDQSCDLHFHSNVEISARWRSKKTREQVYREMNDRRIAFVLKAVNMQPFIKFFHRAISTIKIVHIVRHGLDVALSIRRKGWLSNKSLQTSHQATFRRLTKKGELLPWWVLSGDEEWFLKASEFTRALYCWRVLMSEPQHVDMKGDGLPKQQYLQIRYEDLVQHSEATLDKIGRFLNKQRSAYTVQILESIQAQSSAGLKEYPIAEADPAELKRVNRLLETFNYKALKELKTS